MADVLIRNVPDQVLSTLKKRAADNKRSLQQELIVILENAALRDKAKAADSAALIRERLSEYGRDFSDSTEMIREDRKR